MKTATIAIVLLLLLALPVAASRSDGARRPGRRGALDRGGQGRLRHVRGDREQGLAHARRRPADRGLLSRPRHARACARSTSSSPTARRSPSGTATPRIAASQLLDSRSLTYRQVNEQPGRFRVTKTYVTDPGPERARSWTSASSRSRARSSTSTRYYDPSLGNDGDGRQRQLERRRPARERRRQPGVERAGRLRRRSSGPRADTSGRRATAGRTCATSA